MRELRSNLTIALLLGAFVVAISLALTRATGLGIPPYTEVREMAKTVLQNSYNPWNKTLTSYSLNAVSAIIWDYRGFDTIMETAVLFTAVAGISCLFRWVKTEKRGVTGGMSVIVKKTVKPILLLTAITSVSVAIHGHLTPGGGFQAGTILAVTAVLVIVAYSVEALYKAGTTSEKILKVRYATLATLFTVPQIPLIVAVLSRMNAYVMQNASKEDSPFTMPTHFLETPLAGSIFIYNLLEFVAVAASLSYLAWLFSLRREELELES